MFSWEIYEFFSSSYRCFMEKVVLKKILQYSASHLCQQLKLAFKLESDLQDTVDWGKK